LAATRPARPNRVTHGGHGPHGYNRTTLSEAEARGQTDSPAWQTGPPKSEPTRTGLLIRSASEDWHRSMTGSIPESTIAHCFLRRTGGRFWWAASDSAVHDVADAPSKALCTQSGTALQKPKLCASLVYCRGTTTKRSTSGSL
jgi:hypothetical protein